MSVRADEQSAESDRREDYPPASHTTWLKDLIAEINTGNVKFEEFKEQERSAAQADGQW